MAFFPVAGCRLYVGDVLEEKSGDFIASDFSGQNWTEVTKWTQMGDVGDTNAAVSVQVIGEGRDKDQKGTADAGSMQNVFAAVDSDAGQAKLRLAQTRKSNYAFRIDMNDAPNSGSNPTPSQRFFTAQVMSARDTGGGANTVRMLTVGVNINSNIVMVAASGSSGGTTPPAATAFPTMFAPSIA